MAVPNCPQCGSWNWHREDAGDYRTEYQAGVNGWTETYRTESTNQIHISCGGCGYTHLEEELWFELVNMEYE